MTWTPLAGRATTPGVYAPQPVGSPIYQATRRLWQDEWLDLSPFAGPAGGAVALRLRTVSDSGTRYDGFSFDSLRVLLYDPAAQPAPAAVGPAAAGRARAGRAVAEPGARDARACGFSLPRDGALSLAIHDVQGRRVRTLAGGPRAAGEYALGWDLRDDGGRRVRARALPGAPGRRGRRAHAPRRGAAVSRLVWALRRLAAMGPAEVAHRAHVAARDRFAPPAYAGMAAAEAGARLFAGGAAEALRTGRFARLPAPGLEPGVFASGPAAAATLAEAAALARGEWTLFGRPVRLGDPPDWNREPLGGLAWPDVPSRAIDYRRTDIAGGARYAWELGRLTMLPTLALAWRLTDERAYAEQAARWLDDFCARAPLGHGIHHTSGIEMAIRVTTMSWTLGLLADSGLPRDPAPALGLVAQQALHCRDHLSPGSSANNHLIAEYGAMVTAGAMLPALRDADRLLEQGLAGLERECLRQIHPDGVTAEQAFGYVPFIWELFLLPFVAAEHAGRLVPDAVKARLAASLEFARALRLPPGRLPQVGDEDDGRVLLAADGPSRLDLVGNALAAWLGADALSDESGMALLLFGRSRAARAAADGRHEFAAGGWTAWRERGLVVTFDHAPLGLGAIAAHGHADALAVTVFRGADAVVLDPGTFAYHEDAAARDRFRATPAHATVNFGGRSQSEMRGPFLWGAKARVRADGDGWRCDWAGGGTHRRKVAVEGGRVTIEDRVDRLPAEIVFPLDPAARVELDGARARVTIGGTTARSRARASRAGASSRRSTRRASARRCPRRSSAPRSRRASAARGSWSGKPDAQAAWRRGPSRISRTLLSSASGVKGFCRNGVSVPSCPDWTTAWSA